MEEKKEIRKKRQSFKEEENKRRYNEKNFPDHGQLIVPSSRMMVYKYSGLEPDAQGLSKCKKYIREMIVTSGSVMREGKKTGFTGGIDDPFIDSLGGRTDSNPRTLHVHTSRTQTNVTPQRP